jgi:hypothetical protein
MAPFLRNVPQTNQGPLNEAKDFTAEKCTKCKKCDNYDMKTGQYLWLLYPEQCIIEFIFR